MSIENKETALMKEHKFIQQRIRRIIFGNLNPVTDTREPTFYQWWNFSFVPIIRCDISELEGKIHLFSLFLIFLHNLLDFLNEEAEFVECANDWLRSKQARPECYSQYQSFEPSSLCTSS